jgi:hypothetical protein
MKMRLALADRHLSVSRAASGIRSFPPTLANRNGRAVRDVACLLSFLFACHVCAQPLHVAVSNAQYTTYVEAQGDPITDYPQTSRTTLSLTPISDELAFPIEFASVTNHAIASAGLFEVSAQAGWGKANATATSQLWFSPVTDQTGSIGIQIDAPLRHGFNWGEISLLDITADSQLWDYHWDQSQADSGNIPWDPAYGYFGMVNFTTSTDFLASDEYELTLTVSANAGDDTANAQIEVTVPEPSTTLLLGVFGAALAILHRRK